MGKKHEGPASDDDISEAQFDSGKIRTEIEELKKEAELENFLELNEAVADDDEEQGGSKRPVVTETIKRIVFEPIDLTDTPQEVQAIKKYCAGEIEDYSSESKEVQDFRVLMMASHIIDKQQHEKIFPNMPPYPPAPPFCIVPTPEKDILALRKVDTVLLLLKLGFTEGMKIDVSKVKGIRISCGLQDEADFIIESVHEMLAQRGWIDTNITTDKDIILKNPDQNDYFYGNVPIVEFDYVRRVCERHVERSGKKELTRPTICLTVVRHRFRREVEPNGEKLVPMRSSYPKLPVSKEVFHDKISLYIDPNPHIPSDPALDSDFISLWDVDQTLSFTINQLSNITFKKSLMKALNLEVAGSEILISVLVEVFYGNRKLADSVMTPWRAVKNCDRKQKFRSFWGEGRGRISFPKLKISDIPREARLCISVLCDNADNVADSDIKEKNFTTQFVKDTGRFLGDVLNYVNPVAYLMQQKQNEKKVLGWVNVLLFDHYSFMLEGEHGVPLWMENKRANPIAVTTKNPSIANAAVLHIDFPQFPKPIVFPKGEPPVHKFKELEDAQKKMEEEITSNVNLQSITKELNGQKEVAHFKYIRKLCDIDPLYSLIDVDKAILWKYRRQISRIPKALPKFLQAVDWTKPAAVHEVHMLLHGGEINYYLKKDQTLVSTSRTNTDTRPKGLYTPWTEMPPIAALELLDARFPDAVVREKAVQYLDKMSDWELKDYLLQLVQVLKYEPYHYSSLARFLLRRAVQSPYVLGQTFYWHLKAEMGSKYVRERHGLLLEEFIQRTYTRRCLLREQYVVHILLDVANLAKSKELSSKDAKKAAVQKELTRIMNEKELPVPFVIPLDFRMEVDGILPLKCKVMDSKKLPLWVEFTQPNKEIGSLKIMFKAGDDLRQDLLTLQILGIMHNMWKRRQLDLRIRAYGCIATGNCEGMIEIVDNSNTVANITKDQGSAKKAFDKDPLLNWIKQQNPDQVNNPYFKDPTKYIPDEEVPEVINNFVHSCAGYGPATYVLGIGDRHNDNIMLTVRGKLFHIDFGHFLGNFKEKYGFKRETTPFVFTPMYAYVMGGKNGRQFKRFCKLACQAFNILRSEASLLVNLFNLMCSTGIPELKQAEDIIWLRDVLKLPTDLMSERMDDRSAEDHFIKIIMESLANKKAQLNDYIHIVAHQ